MAAIAAGELDMTAVPATDTGTQTSFTLTQTTAGTAGNTAITLITGMTANGETTFTGGFDQQWRVNTGGSFSSDGIRKATQAFWIACKGAIDAGELDMTISPTSFAGTETEFTLTQTTAGTAGNTAITLITGITANGETSFTAGRSGPQRYFPRVNKKVVIQSLSIPIPVYVNVDYKIAIKTEYQQQMNDLLAPFIARTGQINAFTMKRNGHLYEAFIDQGFTHNNNVGNLAEDTRMYSSEITIKVLGYLIGEGENDDRPIVRIDENVVELTFPSEGPVPEGNDDFFLP